MEANVTVNCVHPGIVRTGLTRDREGFITGTIPTYIFTKKYKFFHGTSKMYDGRKV